jgi:hypothetical protein
MMYCAYVLLEDKQVTAAHTRARTVHCKLQPVVVATSYSHVLP